MADSTSSSLAGSLLMTLWEQQIIAGCLVDADFAKETAQSRTGPMMSNSLNVLFFGAIWDLVVNNEAVSVATLADHMTDEYGENSLWQAYPEALLNALSTQNQPYRQAALNLQSAQINGIGQEMSA